MFIGRYGGFPRTFLGFLIVKDCNVITVHVGVPLFKETIMGLGLRFLEGVTRAYRVWGGQGLFGGSWYLQPLNPGESCISGPSGLIIGS